MAAPQATADLHDANLERLALLLALVHVQWYGLGDDLDAGWRRIGPRVTGWTSAAMVGAARDGAAMVPVALEQQDMPARRLATVQADRLGYAASDGRSLATLLYGGVVAARRADVASLPERLVVGQKWLDKAITTQVGDASKQASHLAVTATQATGYRRYVQTPCCQNCAVLAGRVYRYNTGFDRHPGCLCDHIPTSMDNIGKEGFSEEIPSPDQILDLTVSQRRAIGDGADLQEVVNRRRDAYRRRMRTPEEPFGTRYKPRVGSLDWIYGRGHSRERTLSLLEQYGYVKPIRPAA